MLLNVSEVGQSFSNPELTGLSNPFCGSSVMHINPPIYPNILLVASFPSINVPIHSCTTR